MPPPLSASKIVAAIRRTIEAGTERDEPQQSTASTAAASSYTTESHSQGSAPPQTQAVVQSERLTSSLREQNILTKAQRHKIALRMVTQENENATRVPSKSVLAFPTLFRGAQNANIARALRYWCERHSIIDSFIPNGKLNNSLIMCRATKNGLRRYFSKTAMVRFRKRAHGLIFSTMTCWNISKGFALVG